MNALLASFQFLPLVLQATLATEHAVASAAGKSKKQIVLSAVSAAAKAGETSDSKTVAVISALVDEVVSALNAAGVFEHGPKPGEAPAPQVLAPGTGAAA
jgi:hypothetical protein